MKSNFVKIILTAFSTLLVLNSSAQSSPAFEKKITKLIAKLKETGDFPVGGKDTLMDLNGDHREDLLIEYYGLAGNGLKNRVTVYLYDISSGGFRRCDQLCDLANPNFYFDKNIVTGYYITPSGGDAIKLKWEKLHLDSLEKITVLVKWEKDSIPRFRITVHNFKTGQTITYWQQLFSLPEEYRYSEYIPLIKSKD